MLEKTRKTYSIDMDLVESVLWCCITIVLFDAPDEGGKGPKDRCLQLCWRSQVGRDFEFDGVRIIWPNMHILKESDLLSRLVDIEPCTQPGEVEHLLRTIGFEREAGPKSIDLLSVWRYEDLRALATPYGIEVLLHENNGSSIVSYQHKGQTYFDPHWTRSPDEERLRFFFAGIVGESQRRRMIVAHPEASIAYLSALLSRADAGNQDARNEVVERVVTHVKEAYGIENLVLLQYVREAILEAFPEAFTEAPYPFQFLEERGYRVVQTVPLLLYEVLRPWQGRRLRLHGSLVREVMNFYREFQLEEQE